MEAFIPVTDERDDTSVDPQEDDMSMIRTAVIISIVTGVTLINSIQNGLLTVALPQIARDLSLSEGLLLWPASVHALACGCTLLICGSLADVFGSRSIYLLGCFLHVGFTLACGLAKTSIQLILFRAFQGLSVSLCLPSAVSIVTTSFKSGSRRNIAFSCLGAGQPLGFSLGLIMSGFLVDSIGWRFGYYISAAVNCLMFVAAIWALPNPPQASISWRRLIDEIDWVGGFLASTSLGLLSYEFAVVTENSSNMREPKNIALLCVAVALLPAFVLWVGRQERFGKPAMIPNSLWKSAAFTCLCLTIFASWAVLNSFQYFATLFFQEVQHLSATQTSIRFLPMAVAGFIANIATGLLVSRVSANVLVISSSLLTAVSSLLMAVINVNSPYWYFAFTAALLSPVAADVLFTISNLMITSAFPQKTHGLAGGVFNTVSQIGNSVGLAVTSIIASAVTAANMAPSPKGTDASALMSGYRATFWTCFAVTVTSCGISVLGLRRAGKVGIKRD